MQDTKLPSYTLVGSTSHRFHELMSLLYKKRYAYLFISPFFILYLIFFLYPTIYAFSISLRRWQGFNTYTYVGLQNYIELLQDAHFLQTVGNSIYLMIATAIPQLILSVLIAVALNSRLVRGRGFWRAVYFAPIILSPVVVGIVFSLIFDKEYGFLNYLLSFVGIEKLAWTKSKELSKLAVSALVVWRWTGWNMVVVLAGLQSIPEELYDAAKVDGASPWSRFFYITLPLLKPVLSFNIMLSIIDGLRLFAEPMVLTKGGPGFSSETMVMYLYHQAFLYFNFGNASAVGVLIFLFVTVIAFFSWRFVGTRGEA